MDVIDAKEFKFIVEMLLHSISNRMQICLRQFYETFGLSTPQAMVLLYVRHCGRGKITEVAHTLHMTNSNLSTICRRLEREGLLTRTRDDMDQRIVWISLTESCQQRLQQLEDQIDTQYLNNLSSVSAWDRETILNGLLKLNEVLKLDGSPDGPTSQSQA